MLVNKQKYHMKKFILLFLLMISVTACKKEAPVSKDNANTTDSNTDEGWVSLFDGKSFEGWHSYLQDTISDQWKIEDGAMYYLPDPDKNKGVNKGEKRRSTSISYKIYLSVSTVLN